MCEKKWMNRCVFYGFPFWLYIGSIKTDHSLSITTLTSLLSLLHCAALITDGNYTVLCVCVWLYVYVTVDVCEYTHAVVSGKLIALR